MSAREMPRNPGSKGSDGAASKQMSISCSALADRGRRQLGAGRFLLSPRPSKTAFAAFTFGSGPAKPGLLRSLWVEAQQNHVCCVHFGFRPSKTRSAAFTWGPTQQNQVCCVHFGFSPVKPRLLIWKSQLPSMGARKESSKSEAGLRGEEGESERGDRIKTWKTHSKFKPGSLGAPAPLAP